MQYVLFVYVFSVCGSVQTLDAGKGLSVRKSAACIQYAHVLTKVSSFRLEVTSFLDGHHHAQMSQYLKAVQ